MYIEINGTDRISIAQSFTITKSLKQRAVADVNLCDVTGAVTIVKGQRIEIGDAFVFFGGTIDAATRNWVPQTDIVFWQLSCVSYEQIPARRLVGQRHYDAQLAGDIIKDLVTNCLTGESVTVVDVLDGPTVGPFDFDYASVEEAFDIVAVAAGMYWDITPALGLRFFERSTYPSPWDVTATSAEVKCGQGNRISAKFDRQGKANRVYVRIGQYVGDLASEVVHGDGATQEFATLQPVGAAPTLLLNASSVTVGILGVDTGKDFYWSLGSQTITQDAAGTLLTSGDDLQIDYQPLTSQVVLGAQDSADITATATLEGLSGIYDVLIEANTPTTRQGAEALAEAYIDAHSGSSVVTIETAETDLDVGMEINVNLPALGLNSDFLIDTLTISRSIRSGLRFVAECSTGGLLPTWQQVIGGGASGSVVGGISIQSSSGSGASLLSIDVDLAALAANTTVSRAVTAGSFLTVRIKQHASTAYQITWGSDFSPVTSAITPTLDVWHAFTFFVGPDSTWWPLGPPVLDIPA